MWSRKKLSDGPHPEMINTEYQITLLTDRDKATWLNLSEQKKEKEHRKQ